MHNVIVNLMVETNFQITQTHPTGEGNSDLFLSEIIFKNNEILNEKDEKS